MPKSQCFAKTREPPFVVQEVERLQVRKREARRFEPLPAGDQRAGAVRVAWQDHLDIEPLTERVDLERQIVVRPSGHERLA